MRHTTFVLQIWKEKGMRRFKTKTYEEYCADNHYLFPQDTAQEVYMKLKLYEKHNTWWCHYCLDGSYTFNIEDIVVGTGRTKEEAYDNWKKLTRESREIGEESNLGVWLLVGASVSALLAVVLFVLSHAK